MQVWFLCQNVFLPVFAGSWQDSARRHTLPHNYTLKFSKIFMFAFLLIPFMLFAEREQNRRDVCCTIVSDVIWHEILGSIKEETRLHILYWCIYIRISGFVVI